MKIAIAGAGIGGLAAAALLARNGHRIDVFDQFSRPEPVGSGLVIQPVGQNVLHRIGTGHIAENAGRRITRMLGHEAGTRRKVLDVSYSRAGAQRYGLALHRSALFNAVLTGATDAGIRLQTGHKITGVTGSPRCRSARSGARWTGRAIPICPVIS